MRGQIIAKQAGMVAGLDVAQAVYQMVDPQVDFQSQVEEGAAWKTARCWRWSPAGPAAC